IQLKNIMVTPDVFGSLIPSGAMVRVFIPDLRDLHYNSKEFNITDTDTTNDKGLFVTYPSFGPLPNFNCLSFADLVIALDSISDQLSQFKAFSFLNQPLPLVNVSITQIIDFAADLAKTFQGLANGDSKT